jgi:hypothetical protein
MLYTVFWRFQLHSTHTIPRRSKKMNEGEKNRRKKQKGNGNRKKHEGDVKNK